MSDRQSVPDGALPVKADRRPYNFSTARSGGTARDRDDLGVHVSPPQAQVTSLTAGDGIKLRRVNHVMVALLHGAAVLRATAAIPP